MSYKNPPKYGLLFIAIIFILFGTQGYGNKPILVVQAQAGCVNLGGLYWGANPTYPSLIGLQAPVTTSCTGTYQIFFNVTCQGVGSCTNSTSINTFNGPISDTFYLGTTSGTTRYDVRAAKSGTTNYSGTRTCVTNDANNACVNPAPDDDSDGVPDYADACRGQGDAGFGVDASGCPNVDTDGDGYYDGVDSCPNQGSIGYGVDATGCPIPPPDSDGDGLDDSIDNCINTPGPVANNGCPIPSSTANDLDGDGIQNKWDRCPDLFGTENGGCPWPDADGDGSPDRTDRCPNQPGPLWNEGCDPTQSQPVEQDQASSVTPETQIIPIAPFPNQACNLTAKENTNTFIYVRQSPSTDSEAIWKFYPNQGPFQILAASKQADGTWYQIKLSDNTGWVRGDNVRYAGNNCDDVLGSGGSNIPPNVTYTVRSGDYLYKIARDQCGDGNAWREIYDANRNVIGNDPNQIRPGQVLTIPCAASLSNNDLIGRGSGGDGSSPTVVAPTDVPTNMSYEQLHSRFITARNNYNQAQKRLNDFVNGSFYRDAVQCASRVEKETGQARTRIAEIDQEIPNLEQERDTTRRNMVGAYISYKATAGLANTARFLYGLFRSDWFYQRMIEAETRERNAQRYYDDLALHKDTLETRIANLKQERSTLQDRVNSEPFRRMACALRLAVAESIRTGLEATAKSLRILRDQYQKDRDNSNLPRTYLPPTMAPNAVAVEGYCAGYVCAFRGPGTVTGINCDDAKNLDDRNLKRIFSPDLNRDLRQVLRPGDILVWDDPYSGKQANYGWWQGSYYGHTSVIVKVYRNKIITRDASAKDKYGNPNPGGTVPHTRSQLINFGLKYLR